MSCRKEKWVKLTQIEESHPELHPKVVQVCLYTGRERFCSHRLPENPFADILLPFQTRPAIRAVL